MLKPSVLVISSPLDLHARAMSWALKQHGCHTTFFDTSLPGDGAVEWLLEIGHGADRLMRNTSDMEFSAVWDRRRFPKNENPRVHVADQGFVRDEATYHDRAVLKMLAWRNPGLRWIDRHQHIDRAENKLEQLVAAKDIGLRVPRTLISRDYARVKSFASTLGSFVVKPYRGHLWYQDDVPRFEAIANLIHDASLLEEASVSVCPAIYQEAVDKKSDIRAVVIGRQIFATRYGVKAGTDANFDCRINIRQEDTTVAEPVELDQASAAGLLSLMDHFGITYASADFAEDAAGNLHFLDLNPQGQFMFNEHFVPKYSLLDSMARHIMGPDLASGIKRCVTLEEYALTEDYAKFQVEYEVVREQFSLPRAIVSHEASVPSAQQAAVQS